MSYVHKTFDGICTDMKRETIKVLFPYMFGASLSCLSVSYVIQTRSFGKFKSEW